METLMELIDKAKIEEEQSVKEDTINHSNVLRELGFTKISDKILKCIQTKNKVTAIAKQRYLKITTKMIIDFLDKKVEQYNEIAKTKNLVNSSKTQGLLYGSSLFSSSFSTIRYREMDFSSAFSVFPETNAIVDIKATKTVTIIKRTNDYCSNKPGTIGKFVWKECPIEEYDGVPPKEVLAKLKIHKDKALFDYFTIATVENIKDPLLFGKINTSDDRYFIAQWDEDILLNDLV